MEALDKLQMCIQQGVVAFVAGSLRGPLDIGQPRFSTPQVKRYFYSVTTTFLVI